MGERRAGEGGGGVRVEFEGFEDSCGREVMVSERGSVDCGGGGYTYGLSRHPERPLVYV